MTRPVAMSLEGRRLDDGQGNYAQAAGTGMGPRDRNPSGIRGRFRSLEGRDSRSAKWTESEGLLPALLPPRQASHCDRLAWHDVTREFRADPVDDEDRLEVRDMRPEASQ